MPTIYKNRHDRLVARNIIRDIEWDKYKRGQVKPARERLAATNHRLFLLIFPPYPIGAAFVGELLVYTSRIKLRDKGRSQG